MTRSQHQQQQQCCYWNNYTNTEPWINPVIVRRIDIVNRCDRVAAVAARHNCLVTLRRAYSIRVHAATVLVAAASGAKVRSQVK